MKKTIKLLCGIMLLIMLVISCQEAANSSVDGGESATISTYTITYNGNGNISGNIPTDNKRYPEGSIVKVLDNTGSLQKTNSIFTGWNTSSDGNGSSYTPGANLNIETDNINLYAIWLTVDGNIITDCPSNLNGDITIPGSITSIGDNAFRFCSNLNGITLPTGITSIGSSAFHQCSQLANITIPSTVTSIGNSAFYLCSSLSSINIPASVTSIGSQAFNKCAGLTNITVDSSNSNYKDIDGVLFNKAGTTLIQFPIKKAVTLYTIPSNTNTIEKYAFSNCSDLTGITISSNVRSVSDYAFNYCTGLTNVTIPANVTSVGIGIFDGCSNITSVTILSNLNSINERMFENCSKLTNITIPSSVTSIGQCAFWYTGLTNITIPSSVSSIGWEAFDGCFKLTTITFNSTTPPTLNGPIFDNTSSSLIIRVPSASVNAYKSAPYWSNYANKISGY